MTNEELEVKKLLDRLSVWIVQIRMSNGIYLYDGNKLAEPLVLKLLNLLYDLELVDLNDEKANMPGIDLSDRKAGIAFQVSTRTDADKVISTLRKALDYNFAGDYPNGIRFFVLSDGGKFEFKRIKPSSILSSFDEERDIIYLEDVAKQIKLIYETDEKKFLELKALIKKEIHYPQPDPEQTAAHNNLEALLTMVKQELQKQGQNPPAPAFVFNRDFAADFTLPGLNLISQREETIDIYLSLLDTISILWLSGSVGTGKTGLAYLMAKHFEPNVFWIDLRDETEGDFITQIVTQLCSHLGIELQNTYNGTLLRLVSQLPKGTVFILNDLPNIAGKEKIKQKCSQLLQALVNGGMKAIVTSNYQSYSDLEVSFPHQLVSQPILPFSDKETGEVLRFYGASEEFISENSSIINTITDGHALLVVAAARYLHDHNWDMSNEVFMDIFKSNYGQEYTAEVYARIIDTTQDEETKTLLYRMGAVLGSFTDKEIGVVGSVAPAILNIHERSQQLKGFWLQELERGRFQLSPLISRLPSNLPDIQWNEINVALGDHILSQKMLSPIDANNALSYYLKGKAFTKLSWVLFKVLEESLKNPSLFFDWSFRIFWYHTSFPPEIPVFFRVIFRSIHIQLSLEKGHETGFLASDLELLLQTYNTGTVAQGYGYMVLSHLYIKNDPVKAMRYFLAAHKGMIALDQQIPSEEGAQNKWRDFIWVSFYSLRTPQQFHEWFVMLEEVKSELNFSEIDTVGPYVAAAHSLVHMAVVREGEDPQQAVDALQTIYSTAVVAGLPLMAIYAIRYIISVQGQYLNDLQTAEQYIAANSDLIAIKPIYTYLLKEEYGRQLYYAGKKEDALAVLSKVIDTEISQPFVEGVEGYRVYAQLIGEKDNAMAHYYICKALDKVLTDPSNGLIQRVKIQGEAGISYWLIGDKIQALHQLAAAYEQLLKNFVGSDEQKAAIIRLAHVANYIKGELVDGLPPTKTADGGDYAIPARGHFYNDHTALLAGGFYYEERKFMGTSVFVEMFEFLGDYTRARAWALYGIEVSLSLPESKYFPVLLKTLCYLIIDRQYIKAVNLYGYIERRLKQIKRRMDEGEAMEGFSQVRALLTVQNDAFMYQMVIIPIALTITHDAVTQKTKIADYRPLIEDLFSAVAAAEVKDPVSIQFAKQLFENILFNRMQQHELQSLLSTYTGEYISQMTAIACLLQSIHADAQQAARLHLSIVKEFDLSQHFNPPFYRFEIIPFLEVFWMQKFEQHSQQIDSPSFWHSKSIPYFRAATLPQKVKSLFKTIVHHLNVPVSPSIENWLDN